MVWEQVGSIIEARLVLFWPLGVSSLSSCASLLMSSGHHHDLDMDTRCHDLPQNYARRASSTRRHGSSHN